MKRCFACCWLLGLLVACRVAQPLQPVAASAPVAPKLPWVATIADSLYARQLLSATGRDTLKQRIATHKLAVEYSVPGRDTQYTDTLADPATVLSFCADLFQQAFYYRLDLGNSLYAQGVQPADSARQRQRQRFTAALRQAHGDTAAALRQLLTPAQLIETRIKAEDSLIRTGWTIYPPFGAGMSASLTNGIAESRSTLGRTRTRTARDYHALGLLTNAQYAVLRRELAADELPDEMAVTQRAAELALDVAAYPVRRQVVDSLLTRLTLAGVLPPGGQARVLADSQVVRRLDLLRVLPYCTHAQLLALDSLPANPQQRYAHVLAVVAGIWPAFRYADVRVQVHEHRRYRSREQQATLSFWANGRRYATSFVLDYDLDRPPAAVAAQRPLHYLPDELVALLNQYLRDQRSSVRLYLAAPEHDPTLTDTRAGLLLLTEAQRAAWGPASRLLQGPPRPDTLFTSARIEQALALYQRLGLLVGLSPAELAQGREQALSGNMGSYASLLACFPRLVVHTGGEDAEQPQAYAQALRQAAAATRGAFHPTRIRDTFAGEIGRKQHSTISFVAGGRRYRAALTSDLGWMINDFTALMQQAVRETTTGQLYYLGYGDETGLYLFLTTTQAAALRRAQPVLFREHDAEVVRARQPQTFSPRP